MVSDFMKMTKTLVVRFGSALMTRRGGISSYKSIEGARNASTDVSGVSGGAVVVEIIAEDLPNAEDTQQERWHWLVKMSERFALRAAQLIDDAGDILGGPDALAEELYAHHETAMQWHARCAQGLAHRVKTGEYRKGPTAQQVRAVIHEMEEKIGVTLGCSNGNCIFGPPGGMHTNGPCHCLYDRGFFGEGEPVQWTKIARAMHSMAVEIADRRNHP